MCAGVHHNTTHRQAAWRTLLFSAMCVQPLTAAARNYLPATTVEVPHIIWPGVKRLASASLKFGKCHDASGLAVNRPGVCAGARHTLTGIQIGVSALRGENSPVAGPTV